MYGAMSFVDKVSCGAILIVIQNNAPIKLHPCEMNCDYFLYVLVIACGFASVFGLLAIGALFPMSIGQR